MFGFVLDKEKSLFEQLNRRSPSAIAEVRGSADFPELHGTVEFYEFIEGTVVVSEIYGLPETATNIFAQHVHNGGECSGDFSSAKGHFNPTDQPHPNHAGDLPPLFSNKGYAWNAVFTARFKVEDVIGRSLMIHHDPDDFTTQPGGNSGTKIACGVIEGEKNKPS